MSKEVTCAREMAILGDYDGAIEKFQSIFKAVHSYAKRYEGGGGAQASGAGYAAQTASSAKKVNSSKYNA